MLCSMSNVVGNTCYCGIEIAGAQLSNIINRKWIGLCSVSGISLIHTVNGLLLVYLTGTCYKHIIIVSTMKVRKKHVFNLGNRGEWGSKVDFQGCERK